jgi:hypothetical protein
MHFVGQSDPLRQRFAAQIAGLVLHLFPRADCGFWHASLFACIITATATNDQSYRQLQKHCLDIPLSTALMRPHNSCEGV